MFRSGIAILAVLLAAAQLSAQEPGNYTLGAGIDIVSGRHDGQNPLGFGLDTGKPPAAFFYEAYPSLRFHSAGRHSSFDTAYTFGYSKFKSDLNYNSNSHAASLAFSSNLGPKWKFSVADAFQLTSNITTLNGTQGVVLTPTIFHFLVDSEAFNRSSRSNSAKLTLDYDFSEKSTLSIGTSHALLRYDGETLNGALSDQQRISADISYSKAVTVHGRWSVSYTGSYMDFEQFDSGRSHSGSVGYSHQLRPGFNVMVAGGPTYVQTKTAAGNYASYNARASLEKRIKANNVGLTYTHESGGTAGVGSIADNDRLGVSVSRMIGKEANVFVDISAFNAHSQLGDALSMRGGSAAANLNVPLNRMVSLRWGAQYQRYANTALFPFEQKRVYFSLRLNVPELWKHSR